jgi:hypothetical protein
MINTFSNSLEPSIKIEFPINNYSMDRPAPRPHGLRLVLRPRVAAQQPDGLVEPRLVRLTPNLEVKNIGVKVCQNE